jgi:hypothetical protein
MQHVELLTSKCRRNAEVNEAVRIPGQRIKRTRLIQTDKYVVAVEVEMVIPPDDPSEPCYESETVQLLREIKEHAERGDIDWLREQGKVYAALADSGE